VFEVLREFSYTLFTGETGKQKMAAKKENNVIAFLMDQFLMRSLNYPF
jgi:hypothetical protein